MISYRFYSSRLLWSIDPSLIPPKKAHGRFKGNYWWFVWGVKTCLKEKIVLADRTFFFWWGRSSVTFHFYISKCMYLWLCAWKKKWNSHKKKKERISLSHLSTFRYLKPDYKKSKNLVLVGGRLGCVIHWNCIHLLAVPALRLHTASVSTENIGCKTVLRVRVTTATMSGVRLVNTTYNEQQHTVLMNRL